MTMQIKDAKPGMILISDNVYYMIVFIVYKANKSSLFGYLVTNKGGGGFTLLAGRQNITKEHFDKWGMHEVDNYDRENFNEWIMEWIFETDQEVKLV